MFFLFFYLLFLFEFSPASSCFLSKCKNSFYHFGAPKLPPQMQRCPQSGLSTWLHFLKHQTITLKTFPWRCFCVSPLQRPCQVYSPLIQILWEFNLQVAPTASLAAPRPRTLSIFGILKPKMEWNRRHDEWMAAAPPLRPLPRRSSYRTNLLDPADITGYHTWPGEAALGDCS